MVIDGAIAALFSNLPASFITRTRDESTPESVANSAFFQVKMERTKCKEFFSSSESKSFSPSLQKIPMPLNLLLSE